MSPLDQKTKLDRRAFLKTLGAAGATATFVAASAPQSAQAATQGVPGKDLVAGLTGGKWDKSVALASAGPGGNMNWQPGDSVKFLPPEKIAGGRAADALTALPKGKLLTIYERMNLSRKWETTFKDLFVGGKDGLYGSFHPYIGEEAIAAGVMIALNDDDFIASTHRGHGHLIAKGGDLNKMSAEIFFKETGYNKAYGGSMHITDMAKGIMGMNGIVAAGPYLAAGAAMGALVRGTKQVSVVFHGDGACNSPYFFSAVRSATNYKLPVVWVIENNFQMIAVPMATVTPTKYIADYVKGLGIPATTIDGNDVAAVYATAKEAVDRARAGEGPSVIEAMTFRWLDHSGFAGARVGVDGAAGLPYRSDNEVRQWMSRDPIKRFKAFLLDRKLASPGELEKIEADAQKAVDDSITFARNSKNPDPVSTLKNVYASGEVTATQFFNRRGLVS
jgi:TPP-dependent pyruvate/acetoin dehydrogenase alpha subunit